MRRRVWLAMALLLFGLAAFLMSRGDAPPRPARPEVAFPRYMNEEAWNRQKRRRTLPVAPAPVAAREEEDASDPPRAAAEAEMRDPVLTALSAGARNTAVVVEANALRHSPIGELVIDCLLAGEAAREMERLREELGFDVFEDVDRVALSDEVLVVSGHFQGAKWESLELELVPYGQKARITPAGRGETAAIWNDELLLLGDDRAKVEEALDRLEGRLPPAAQAIDETMTYGEIYGVIGARQLATLLPGNDELARRIRETAERVELHVDASDDVAIVADVGGPEPDKVIDLGKSLGAALAVARLQATARGEDALAELLELARVQPRGDRFALEMALPLPLLQRHLADVCGRATKSDPSPP